MFWNDFEGILKKQSNSLVKTFPELAKLTLVKASKIKNPKRIFQFDVKHQNKWNYRKKNNQTSIHQFPHTKTIRSIGRVKFKFSKMRHFKCKIRKKTQNFLLMLELDMEITFEILLSFPPNKQRMIAALSSLLTACPEVIVLARTFLLSVMVTFSLNNDNHYCHSNEVIQDQEERKNKG